jgi:NADPH:quinone reductase-like Zn-dependent oxidoreductase
VGDVVAVGEGVTRFKGGERVGGAWHGGIIPYTYPA